MRLSRTFKAGRGSTVGMQGGSGPWRGHRGRRRPAKEPSKPPETWKRVEDPPAPQKPRPPPAGRAEGAGPAPRPETSARDDDAEPGDPDSVAVSTTPTFSEQHLERTFLVGAIAYVLILFDVVYGGAATWFDGLVMDAVVVLPETLRAVTGLVLSIPGDRWLLAVLVALVALRVWSKGSTRSAVLIAASAFSLMLFIEVTKWIVDRPRPTTFFAGTEWLPQWLFSTSTAFPSGHSGAPVLVYGLILIALWGPGATKQTLLPVPRAFPTKVLAAALLLAFLPGLGRILWGFHWATDVLGGWLLGLAWLTGTLLVANFWGRSQQTDEELESGEVEPTRSDLGGLYD